MSPAFVPVTRFAPSPTGFLHLGHAHSALVAARAAALGGGRFLLRIEDIDTGRCRPDFAAAIEEDLAWLGLAFERPVRRQSAHFEEYRRVLEALKARGLVYPCFCTRAEIFAEIAKAASAPQGPDGPLYPGTCRRRDPAQARAWLEEGRAHAWRLDAARAAQSTPPLRFREHGVEVPVEKALFGDAVLARKDIPTSYHLAVVHDDYVQGVTLVTRGDDLLPATHLHRLLQHLLGYAAPDYAHHRVLRDPQGRRLAKRDGDKSLRDLRRSGAGAAQVRAAAGFPD